MAEPFSRRDFLKLGALVTASAALAACAPTPVVDAVVNLEPPPNPEMHPIEPSAESPVQIRLGEERNVDIQGLDWVPDTRTSYIKKGDKYQFYFSAGREGFVVDGNNLQDLGEPRKYLWPSLKQGEYGINCYRAPGTVFEDGMGNTWSLDHTEEWPRENDGGNFTARIALSQSTDGGNTWVDRGIILDGQAAEVAGNKVSGAGQPSGILKDVDGVNYLYMYYTDWGVGPDSIHLARVPLGQIDNPNAWQKNNGGEFSSTGAKGLSTPVIVPNSDEVYAALSSVTFNTHMGKYMATFEGSSGFWLSTSIDGINWENHQKIVEFPQAHDKVVSGSSRFSYPTLLSLGTANQFVTGNTGTLVYSRGVYDALPNQMKSREFSIS